jgi:quercetin dioxygenase-like cupin family protein
MRTVLIIGMVALGAFFLGQVTAAPSAKHLIDATPAESVLINLKDWFAQHPIKEGAASRSDNIFTSPRLAVNVGSSKDYKGVGRHIHTSVDELIYMVQGEGEIYLNGKWMPFKTGDLHVCPRGVAHGTRALPGKDYMTFNLFTPPQPKGGDRVMLDE